MCSLDRPCHEGCEGRSVCCQADCCAHRQTPALLYRQPACHSTPILQPLPYHRCQSCCHFCALLPGPHVLNMLSSRISTRTSGHNHTGWRLSTRHHCTCKAYDRYCLLTTHVCREHGLCTSSKCCENWRSKLGYTLQIQGRHETQSAS
jgi:hypothetical protein